MRHATIVFAVILLSCFLASCGEGLVISMDENVPPIFRYRGNRFAECCKHLNFFVVKEVSLDNPAGNDEAVWWIRPNETAPTDGDNLPAFTYGKVPEGWRQTVPEQGEPPPLIEGRTYEAGGNFHSGHDAHLRFIIRGGKALKVQ